MMCRSCPGPIRSPPLLSICCHLAQTEPFHAKLHHLDNGPTVIQDVQNSSNNIREFEKGLGMGGDEHEEGHNLHGQPQNRPNNGKPQEEVADEALYVSCEVARPRASARGRAGIKDKGVPEARKNSGIRVDVLEDEDNDIFNTVGGNSSWNTVMNRVVKGIEGRKSFIF
ncbi:hypothetical protein DM860_015480 [Cuscuta australis]|uniref:Uncharacterized protein n=1 Tax=Cuscuta australis TaxID=267555 RepID=A0A328E764_9ASTE|nr:hypothetical protein DM860_015480 [Cuscuta australis]